MTKKMQRVSSSLTLYLKLLFSLDSMGVLFGIFATKFE